MFGFNRGTVEEADQSVYSRRFKFWLAITVFISLAIVIAATPSVALGLASDIDEAVPGPVTDPASLPPAVVADAQNMAEELFEDEGRIDYFKNQLLYLYNEASQKDLAIIFNSGGWGWSTLKDAPGWTTIINGMSQELSKANYESIWLDYRRTANTASEKVSEMIEMVTLYPVKARDLAYRIQFLTAHLPELRVILTGESNGCILVESALRRLRDNDRVFSIQTGPPFWMSNEVLERTLVMRDNGIIPDSFSNGDALTIVAANLESLLGFPRPENEKGKILTYLGAPGHDYWWQYPEVQSRIMNFLEDKLGI